MSDSAERKMTDHAVQNTDRDLWREPPGDYYANRIFLTEGGGIGLDVGGHCIVKPIADWHKLASSERREPPSAAPTDDAFESAWKEYNANGNAGGWERVAFISGFGKGFRAALQASEAAKSAAVGPEPKSPWINVEERLPEKNDEFLVKCSDCDYAIPADWDGGTWKTVRGYGNEGEALELHLVTHWMLMPDPPEAVGPEPAKEKA